MMHGQPPANDRRRRALVIAYECNPKRGSESGAGFSLLEELRRSLDCTVLVGWRDGDDLERWADDEADGGVQVVQPGESAFGRALFRAHRYPRFLAYLLWLRRIKPVLLALAESGDYDLAWHLTYSPFWLPTPLRHLRRLPTVWGPVTGGDRTPRELRGALGRSARAFETLDILATNLFRRMPSVRKSHREVDLVLSSLDRPEVEALRHGRPVWLFPQSVLARVEPELTDRPRGTIEEALYFVSPLRPQKGPHLALRAAARDPGIRLVFAPPHDERALRAFRELVEDLGMTQRVEIVDLTRDEMMARLRASRGVVHTAMNDSSSMSLSEALSLGVPVIGLDVTGTRAVCHHAVDQCHIHLARVGEADQVVAELSTLMSDALRSGALPERPLLDHDALRDRLVSAADEATTVHRARAGHSRRVAQVFYAVQDRGGEVVARVLADGFRERGLETVNLGAFRASPMNSSTEDFEILCPKRPSTLGNLRLVFAFFRRFRRLKPDVVIFHTDAAQLLGAPAAWLARVPSRVCVNHLPLGTYVRSLRYVHSLFAMLGLYSDVVFVGESAYRDAERLPMRFRRKCHLINNAVQVTMGDRIAARRRFGIADDAFVFLNVGSCTHQKNQATLIAAMREVPDALLVIAGAGELEGELHRAAADLADRVRFIGRRSPDEMGDVYALADVFVFPSRYEGRPLALLEAASARLPIIASSIPENREVTRDAVEYAAAEDPAAWARLMRRAADDPSLVADLQRRIDGLDIEASDAMVDAYVRLLV